MNLTFPRVWERDLIQLHLFLCLPILYNKWDSVLFNLFFSLCVTPIPSPGRFTRVYHRKVLSSYLIATSGQRSKPRDVPVDTTSCRIDSSFAMGSGISFRRKSMTLSFTRWCVYQVPINLLF